MQPIPAQRTIIASIPAGTTKGANVLFPIDKFLLNMPIVGIETLNEEQQKFASNGQPVISAADALIATLTLVSGSAELHKAIPLPLLNTVQLSGLYKTIPPTVIDWNSSYVTFTDAPAVGTAFAIPLIVHYRPQ